MERWEMEAMRPLTKEELAERDRRLAPLMRQAEYGPEDYARMQNVAFRAYRQDEDAEVPPPSPWWMFWKRRSHTDGHRYRFRG